MLSITLLSITPRVDDEVTSISGTSAVTVTDSLCDATSMARFNSTVWSNTKVLRQVTLVLDQTVELNLAMEVASHKESVTVTAEVPLIDVTSSSTRGVIESSVIDSIPLNGRNYL